MKTRKSHQKSAASTSTYELVKAKLSTTRKRFRKEGAFVEQPVLYHRAPGEMYQASILSVSPEDGTVEIESPDGGRMKFSPNGKKSWPRLGDDATPFEHITIDPEMLAILASALGGFETYDFPQ